MQGDMEIIQRVTASHASLPPEPIAKDVSAKPVAKEAVETFFMCEIRKADAKLTEELGKKKLDLLSVVTQMGKIQAMLARMSVEVYGATINSRTDELEDIIVKLQSTYKTRNWTWIMHGSSFAIQIFAAAAGLGVVGNTMKAGAATLNGIPQGIQIFAQIFEKDLEAQRTVMKFIEEETKRMRSNAAEANQRSMQDFNKALDTSKKASDEHTGAVNNAARA